MTKTTTPAEEVDSFLSRIMDPRPSVGDVVLVHRRQLKCKHIASKHQHWFRADVVVDETTLGKDQFIVAIDVATTLGESGDIRVYRVGAKLSFAGREKSWNRLNK